MIAALGALIVGALGLGLPHPICAIEVTTAYTDLWPFGSFVRKTFEIRQVNA